MSVTIEICPIYDEISELLTKINKLDASTLKCLNLCVQKLNSQQKLKNEFKGKLLCGQMIEKVKKKNKLINAMITQELPILMMKEQPEDLDEFENKIFVMVDVLSYY